MDDKMLDSCFGLAIGQMKTEQYAEKEISTLVRSEVLHFVSIMSTNL
jgi:hypothetical protein